MGKKHGYSVHPAGDDEDYEVETSIAFSVDVVQHTGHVSEKNCKTAFGQEKESVPSLYLLSIRRKITYCSGRNEYPSNYVFSKLQTMEPFIFKAGPLDILPPLSCTQYPSR